MPNQSSRATGASVGIRWGDTLLAATFVNEARSVVVANRGRPGVDLVVESSTFASPTQIADVRDDSVVAFVPVGADGPRPGSHTIAFGEWIAWRLDGIEYVVGHQASGVAALPPPNRDWQAARVFAISSLFHGFFMAAAWITPTPSVFRGLTALRHMPQSTISSRLKPAKPRVRVGIKTSGRHEKPDGKFGRRDHAIADAAPSKPGAPRIDPNKRQRDRSIASRAGLLGILKGFGAESAVTNVLGPGGLGSGVNEALGGLRGESNATAGGLGGMGSRGTGAGGGGRSIGIGGIGFGDGRGRPGGGDIDIGGGGRRTVKLLPSKTIMSEGLEREEVARVIRRNLVRFKYCYEKQLNANPNLSGKVSIAFTIAPTGQVARASVREDTVGEPRVGHCVRDVMRNLKFPKPKGGGIVIVTYPFLFEAA